MYRIDKTVRDRKQMSSCRGHGIGESECLIGAVSFGGDEDVLELGNGDGCTTLGIY